MASALSDRLSRLVKSLRGQARITEANVQDMLREVRMALLEADVALPVVRDFVARVKDKALGQEVVGSLNPGLLVRLVVDEGRVTREERMLGELRHRIRDVRQGPDGLIYLLTDSPDGLLVRLAPA